MNTNMENMVNGWNEWSKHVLAELTRLSEGLADLIESENNLKVDVHQQISNLHQSFAKEISKQTEQHRKAYADDKKEQEKVNTEFKLALLELKIKAGIWGLMGGLIPVLVTLLLMFIGKILNVI